MRWEEWEATSVAWHERMAALFTHWHCCDGKEEDLVLVLKGHCLLGIESTWRKQVKRLACGCYFWIIDYYICAVFYTWEPNANFHKVEEESRSYLSLCYLPHFSVFKMSFLPVLLSENSAETSGRRADNAYGGLKCRNSEWVEQKKKKKKRIFVHLYCFPSIAQNM